MKVITEFLSGWPLHITTGLLIVLVYFIAPHQLGIVAYKASLIYLAIVLVYWASRWILKFDVTKLDTGNLSRDDQRDLVILMAAAMIAAGLAA